MRRETRFWAVMGATLFVLALCWSLAAMEKPDLKGIAYIATEGGHVVKFNLANKEIKRLKITQAGSEMEGVIAGQAMGSVEKGGGMHGVALSPDKKKLYVGLLNGRMVTYDFATEKLSDPMLVGKKVCGMEWSSDGYLYLGDMADGSLYAWDTKANRLANKIPVSKAICGIQWSKDGKYAYLSDMVLGTVEVMDWSSKKIIKKIPIGTFIHQVRMTPDGRELWVTAPNEFKDLKPYSVAGKGPSEVVILDTATNGIKGRIAVGDRYPHDIEFSPDGRYALVTARAYTDDSVLLVYDVRKKERLEENSLCKGCHQMTDAKMTAGKSPNLCGIAVDWSPKRAEGGKAARAKSSVQPVPGC